MDWMWFSTRERIVQLCLYSISALSCALDGTLGESVCGGCKVDQQGINLPAFLFVLLGMQDSYQLQEL